MSLPVTTEQADTLEFVATQNMHAGGILGAEQALKNRSVMVYSAEPQNVCTLERRLRSVLFQQFERELRYCFSALLDSTVLIFPAAVPRAVDLFGSKQDADRSRHVDDAPVVRELARGLIDRETGERVRVLTGCQQPGSG